MAVQVRLSAGVSAGIMHRIGRYEIQAELGRGGFGQVYRAFDPTVGRLVAIKTLTAAGDPELLRRFRNEATAAGKLRHNNIVIIYDFGDDEGTPYLVMELLDGEDLEHIINTRRPLTLLQKLDIIAQSAAGLHHAHSRGIVHRDVKPANIMLQHDGVVKIMDFGIALLTQATAARMTPKGSIIGTFPYMAPEQFSGSASDALTDVFAFGVTCYKLLTGTHPFHAEDMGAMMFNIMNKAPEPLRSVSPECPEALEQAVLKMLAKDRDARYQSLEDVRFDIGPVILDLRKEHVNDLLAEARDHIAGSRLDDAQSLIRKVLEEDPANRTARDLRDTVARQLRENEIRPRIAALVKQGREHLDARRFEAAIKSFESALQVDRSNPELHQLIQEARAAWERAQRTARLLEDAQRSLARGDLTAANHIVHEALSLDPRNPQADEMRGAIEEQLEVRERERQLEEGLNHARRLILVESYEDAIRALEDLSGRFPESTAARDLLARARHERENQLRRERLERAIAEARALLKNGDFQAALDKITANRSEFPESAELRDLASFATEELQSQQRAQAVAKAAAEARSLTEGHQYDAALDVLHRAIGENPGANSLREMVQTVMSAKADHERRENLAHAVAETRGLLEKQRFREAAERISSFVRAYGEAAELEALRREADEGLEKQRKFLAIRKVLLDARSLLDDNRADDATRVLQSGTMQFPEDPELARLLMEAQERVRQQRQAEAISKIISEAESLARARQFDRAVELLDKGLEDYSGSERLIRCREAVLATQARRNRDQAERDAINRIRTLRQNGKIDEALSAIDAALRDFGDNSALLDLRRQIAIDQVAHERAAEITAAVERVQALLDGGELTSAVQVLDGAMARFPGEEVLGKWKRVADAKLAELRREHAIAGVLSDARAQFDLGSLDRSLGILEDAIRQYGARADLVRARDGVAAAKAASDRNRQREQAVQKVRELQSAGRADEALAQVAAALDTFVDDAELVALRTQLQGAQQRRNAIASAVHEAERLARAEKYDESLRVVDAALAQYPGTDELVRLRASIQTADLRAQALADARRLYAAGQLEAALKILSHALENSPADAEVRELKQRIESDRDRQRRSEAIENALKEASALLASARPDAAVALLRRVAAEDPDVRISNLLASAEDALRRAERDREIASVKANAEALIAERKYTEALELLDARFAGEPKLEQLRMDAERRRESERQRADIQLARSQLLEIEQKIGLTRKSRLPAIAAEVRRIAARHAEDADLAAIAARIERQITAVITAPDLPPKPLPWRRIGGVGAAAVLIVAAVGAGRWWMNRPRVVNTPQPSMFAVDVRTDPPGANVAVAGRSCTPPGCQFSLPAGEYAVRARLKGYKPAQRTLIVDAQHPPGITNITLEPEAPALPPPGSQSGTLFVRAAVPDARVLVDSVPRGLTDASGSFRTSLTVGSHDVRVEKAGYRGTPDQRISIAQSRTREYEVALAPIPPKLEIRGAPAGIQVRAGTEARTTDGSALFAMDVKPSTTYFRVSDGKATWDVGRVFLPGTTVAVDWRDIAAMKPATPSSPARPPVKIPDRQDSEWERVRASSDPDQIEGFLREFRNGSHADEAQARLADVLWARTNQSDIRSLQAYIGRVPHSAHAADAQKLVDDLTWNGVNKNSVDALKGFVDQYGSSRHRAEAQALIDRMIRDREAAEARAKATAEQRDAIRSALQRFNDAFVHKSPRELKEIWPTALPEWAGSMNQRGAYFVAALYPVGDPEVAGTKATIRCDLITQTIFRGQPQPQNRKSVKVTLRKVADQWVIEDPRGTE